MRSLRSRSSRTSTHPLILTVAGAASTGCAMAALRSVATAKPAAAAMKPRASGKAIGRRRSKTALTTAASASVIAAQPEGSRSAVK